ncbi:hypothetical protein SLINC_3477 [Streptomyces lincolnensis]|uniref:Uncharacterized protein n=2 Tax=Streptomyces lincolnensis TaxID=1915 RepID=A0A1B1MAQ4_STRLN|nr:hypothetical protein SLINC_3477 [Streptomyces lincolnensis]AXG54536.1 hypothetical protein SLCG_3381 [Streptomyces lincolnensis]
MSGKVRIPVLMALCALLVLPLAGASAVAADGPGVKLSRTQAGTGGSITVTGEGWRARTLLMILICGQSVPSRGVAGGTDSCANADGRAVTTDAEGRFSRKLPVAEPPVPCPCVVHVATVTGAKAEADAIFQVAGHAVEPLPADTAGGRLSVLTDTRLEGSGGLLTWFGSAPARTIVLTVGNVGTSAVEDPVFQVGTSHGVFAPEWQEQRWRGTVQPGGKARIELPVELPGGAHGDYTVSLKYGGKVLAEQPWDVGRPWGVTLFWILVCLVVPAALFRAGMAVVDRIRPRRAGGVRHRGLRLPELALHLPGVKPSRAAHRAAPSSPALPWFAPDADPGTAGRLSAPHDDSPTSPTTPTTPTTKGPP